MRRIKKLKWFRAHNEIEFCKLEFLPYFSDPYFCNKTNDTSAAVVMNQKDQVIVSRWRIGHINLTHSSLIARLNSTICDVYNIYVCVSDAIPLHSPWFPSIITKFLFIIQFFLFPFIIFSQLSLYYLLCINFTHFTIISIKKFLNMNYIFSILHRFKRFFSQWTL